jgi:hypothetical protein
MASYPGAYSKEIKIIIGISIFICKSFFAGSNGPDIFPAAKPLQGGRQTAARAMPGPAERTALAFPINPRAAENLQSLREAGPDFGGSLFKRDSSLPEYIPQRVAGDQ